MEATIKSASDLAGETIDALKKIRKDRKTKRPASKAPAVEIKYFVMAVTTIIILSLAYLSCRLMVASLFPTHIARGTLAVRSRPLKNVSIIFQCPKSKKTYSNKTDEKGRYEIEVPHGTFKVAVMGDEIIPSRYMNARQSPLKADVFHDVTLDFSIADK